MELSERTAVVTGASAGIGAAVARHLHAAGANVVVHGRRGSRLAELCEELPGAVSVAGDIAEPSLPLQLMDKALGAFGRCDVVVNNAGLMTAGDIESIDIEEMCRMTRVNVEAAFRMAYVALRHFRKAGEGHLVNTSSVLGTKVRKFAGAYCGTKFAIEALSEALRMELARSRVRVSCVEPGLVLTELHRHMAVHPTEAQGVEHPLTPDDVARSVLFILQQPDHVAMPRLLVVPSESEI